MKIVNIYPSQMRAHLQTMVKNNDILFLNFEYSNIFSGSFWGTIRSLYILGSAGFCSNFRGSGQRTNVIFHSAHFPKSWIFILISGFLFPTTLVVWGGEFSNKNGIRQVSNKIIRAVAVRLLKSIVFLSKSDARDVDAYLPDGLNRHLIHYYHPSYMRPCPPLTGDCLRVQIGNSGEEANGHLACIDLLENVEGVGVDLIIPLGYHLDEDYGRILDRRVKMLPQRFRSELVFDLLDPDGFDALIDNCDALLISSKRQRALYSIYRYIASGRPVFLPKDAVLKRDLEALGFEIQALEDIAALDAEAFRRLCRSRNTSNVATARACLSLDAIRSDWQALLTSEGRGVDGV